MYRPPSNPPPVRPASGDSMNGPPRPPGAMPGSHPPAAPVQPSGPGMSSGARPAPPVPGPRPQAMQQPPPFRPQGAAHGPPHMRAPHAASPQPPPSFGAPRPSNPPPSFGHPSHAGMQQQTPPIRPSDAHQAPGGAIQGTMQPPAFRPPPSFAQRPTPLVRPGAPQPPLSSQGPPPPNPVTNGAAPPPGPGMPRPPFPAAPHTAPGAHPMGPPPPPIPGTSGFQPTTTPPGPGPFAGRASHDSSPKIDPSQMPRPLSKEVVTTKFQTRLNGHHQLPPPASEKRACEDTGNCDPKFMRLSMNNVPSTAELCNNLSLPLVAFMQPLALQNPDDEPVPVVDFGESGPVRCGRCRAYMNPFMMFEDAGRSFVCVFCKVKNETPADYFCYLGYDGKRRDAQDRPELSKGTVEFVAPRSFMVRNPMPPVHFFLIDAGYTSASSGALHTMCNSIKTVLDSIQGQDRALVGIASFGPSIEFYHVKNSDGTPQLLVVSDITEVFAPLPTLLMSLKDHKGALLEILDIIPKLHENQTSGESCAAAAIEAAVEVLKPTGGKLHAILTTRPTKGSRALKPRDTTPSQSPDKAEKEKQMILLPQDNTYRTLGLAASEASVCVDLFCLARNYMDISTLGVLSHVTGGSVYHYDNFTVQHHSQQFLNDLRSTEFLDRGFDVIEVCFVGGI